MTNQKFEEWYEANKEPLTMMLTKSKLRMAFEAGAKVEKEKQKKISRVSVSG